MANTLAWPEAEALCDPNDTGRLLIGNAEAMLCTGTTGNAELRVTPEGRTAGIPLGIKVERAGARFVRTPLVTAPLGTATPDGMMTVWGLVITPDERAETRGEPNPEELAGTGTSIVATTLAWLRAEDTADGTLIGIVVTAC